MKRPITDGVRPPRNPPRWSARALKRQGTVWVLLGIVGAIVGELLAVFNRIDLAARDTALRGSVVFALVGLATFLIGWKKTS